MRRLLAVVLLASAVWTVGKSPVATALPDWRPFIDAGETVALAVTNIDYRVVDRDVQHVLDNATGTFYDDFSSRAPAFTEVVLDAKSTSTGTVTESRLDSTGAGRVKVFVAVTVNTTNEGQPPSPPRYWRLLITVQKVGDAYKASNLEFLP